ncbi:hypothetical protein QU487_16295 [Crenobacter sp. SG2305]|uniref:hypothetical protein n=1 Tax=Crenobacter oryzisoli TaxID=3056844 RepID=UPI0025AB18DA|nr:hypothetical protein [Crenobacter sp. SG2305]MDN0084301.1 hypothetical protein [Crenobacter sp. SG2305]
MNARLLAIAGISAGLLAGCANMMSGTNATYAGAYGAKWFEQAGYPLNGLLQCQVIDPKAGSVNCSGVTLRGEQAVMTGDLNKPTGGGSPFVGTVGGREVFREIMH